MFELEDVELTFSEEALVAIAKEAMMRKVGARGLRIILEELMLDPMYNIPSEQGIKECAITEDVVMRRNQPTQLKKAV
jgi:ATP-dependent Clp protease ATP-binding subunit ClpX